MVLARQILKADLRQPITAWHAIVWAYADEHVRAAGEEYNYHSEAKATSSTGRLMNMGIVQGRGAINGRLDCHEDALEIDAFLRVWLDDVDRSYYPGLVNAIENRRRVPMARELVPLHAVPVRRPNGAIKEEYTRLGSHAAPSYCLVEWEGYTIEELAAAQELYDLFIAFLDIMPGLKLSKWRIAERGLDNAGRIIDKGPFNRQK
jgi:hypothetical protein